MPQQNEFKAAAPPRHRIAPAKLLLSKWTAVAPSNKEKHFLVTKVIVPEIAGDPIEWVELEAVHSGRSRRMRWRDLADPTCWIRGWR